MGFSRCLQILTNEEAGKVHKHLINWLSKIVKKRKGIAPRRRCLDYSKVYSDVTERWLLAKTNKLHSTYFIY